MLHNKQLSRVKVAGHFIYFHPDSEIYNAQLLKRQEMIEDQKFLIESVTEVIVIEVLLILIR